jgi:FAD dependent oxidoreductase
MRHSRLFVLLVGILFVTGCTQSTATPNHLEADIVIYGGTSAAVISAVQAHRLGKSVIVVSPDKHLGGLSSGGLAWADSGDERVIGGLSREFYQRVWQYYQRPDTWVWQSLPEFGYNAPGSSVMDAENQVMWMFEPHIAEQVFEDLVTENNIRVYRDEWLDREHGVKEDGARITAISTLSGAQYRAKAFIDATYEGDLMAAAGVSYHVGREANSVYNENWNGIQVGELDQRHHFGQRDISPYTIRGDSSSGLLPGISMEQPGASGQGDHRIPAYNFRMCLSNHPENRVPFPKPTGYRAEDYELLLRVFDSGWERVFAEFDPIPNRKTDTNNLGPFSTDYIGMNYDYPLASYERRREIIKEHETYQKGLMYFMANDPRVPASVRDEMSQWGLAKDEFVDNGHWPHQLYIREARRMVGDYVMTEHDVLGRRSASKPIAVASGLMDSNNVQRYVTQEGGVQNEGDFAVYPQQPYLISYGAITPKKSESENLLVPVSVSSSHIAYGSIGTESVFMILGQSAATAASIAIDQAVAVQDVPYELLRQQLLNDKQCLAIAD